MPPSIVRNALLTIVGEAPGNTEVEEGAVFVGPSGRLLNGLLEKLDTQRADCSITNAVKCKPVRRLSAAEWNQAIICCRPSLFQDLEASGSKWIVAAGGKALHSLTGFRRIMTWAGSVMPGRPLAQPVGPKAKKRPHPGALLSFDAYTVVPAYHPAFCLREPAMLPVLRTHLWRAIALARGKKKPWRWRGLCYRVGPRMLTCLERIYESERPVAVDVETQGLDPRTSKILCLGLSDGRYSVSVPWSAYYSRKSGEVRGLSSYAEGPDILFRVRAILHDRPLVFQNGAYDLTSLKHMANIDLSDAWHWDTIVSHAILAPRYPHKLDFQALLEWHIENWKAIFGAERDQKGADKFADKDEFRLRRYNAKDALVTAKLARRHARRLLHKHNGQALFNQGMKLARRAFQMTDRGISLDAQEQERLRRSCLQIAGKRRAELVRVADKLHMTDFNPDANGQIRSLFLSKLKVRPTRFSETTGEPSFDGKALEALVNHYDQRVQIAARALRRYREFTKLQRTYIDGLPIHNGVVHPYWRTSGPRTGRWSSSPNLQNIPPELRSLFVARPGHWFVEADKSQLELRIVAALAGDKILCDWYKAGKDVHSMNTIALFKIPADRFDKVAHKPQRHLAKRFVYGVNYGAAPPNLWEALHVDFPDLTLSTVLELHTRWFREHPAIYQWIQNTIRETARRDFVECPLSGRRQYYYGKIEPTEIPNFVIQGTAADLMNNATVAVGAALRPCDHLLLQVHDSLMVETTDPKGCAAILREHMSQTEFGMIFPVDIKMGRRWSEMNEIK